MKGIHILLLISLCLLWACTVSQENTPETTAATETEAGWKQLFNGKDLTGWEHVGPGSFVVEDGLLKTVSGMGLLWYTQEKIGNSVVRIVFKTSQKENNSGVFIRVKDKPEDEWFAVHNGYEVQILEPGDEWHQTGSIYSISKVSKKVEQPAGEWHTMEITLDGPKTIVHLNGEKVNEYVEGSPVPERKQDYEPIRGRHGRGLSRPR